MRLTYISFINMPELMKMHKNEAQLSPMKLSYMKIIKFFLTTVGSWPSFDSKGKLANFKYVLKRYNTLVATIMVFAESTNLFINFDVLSFIDVGDRLFTLFISLLTMYRSWLSFFSGYPIILNKFIREFHMIHFKNKSDYFNKIYDQMNVLSYYYTLFMSSALVSCMLFFNSSALWNNLKNRGFTNRNGNYTFEFSVYYSLPLFNQKDHIIVSTLYNVVLSYNCAVLMNINDTIVTVIVLQIIGHIKTLQHDLCNFPTPKSKTTISFESPHGEKSQIKASAELFNKEENALVRLKLSQCIKHHKLIANFTNEFSEFFGSMIGLNYLFQACSCCLILLECSLGPPEVLLRFGPLGVAIFFQLCHISIVFEVVGSESEKLIDAVYLIPWECMNVSNQRTMCILLHRFQTPVQVMALGMTPVGVQTMLGILKATFSYFTLLESLSI